MNSKIENVGRKGLDKLQDLQKKLEDDGLESWWMAQVTISTYINDLLRQVATFQENFPDYMRQPPSNSPAIKDKKREKKFKNDRVASPSSSSSSSNPQSPRVTRKKPKIPQIEDKRVLCSFAGCWLKDRRRHTASGSNQCPFFNPDHPNLNRTGVWEGSKSQKYTSKIY